MVRPSGFEPPRGQPPLAPEASASAVSPRPHSIFITDLSNNYKWCRGPESNRYGCFQPRDFKSRASASSATPAKCLIGAGDGNRTHVTSLEGWGSTIELHPQCPENGADNRNRTYNLLITSQLLCQLSYVSIKWCLRAESNH